MFLGRYTSPKIFLKGFHLGWKHHNLGEKSGSELKENPENKNLIYQGKFLINKSWLNFWALQHYPPLRKISSSRFARGCFEKELLLLSQSNITKITILPMQ